MSSSDDAAREEAAWASFVAALKAHLAAQWPALPTKIGERYDAFVELAVQQALQRGWSGTAAVARFAQLWAVWGAGWHDKPGFEWAQRLLAAPAAQEWSTIHQLVRRSLAELAQLPGTRIEPRVLAEADARVIERFGPLGRRGRMLRPPEQELPQAACDLEAAELRALDDVQHLEYQLAGTEWQRAPAALPPALRIDAARPLPAFTSLLSPQAGQGAPWRAQARLRPLVTCGVDHHPAVWFDGTHGRWAWHGHESRAVSWPLATREQADAPAGPGTRIADETSPEPYRLQFQTCGLRDEGDPLGAQATELRVYPAAQWWVEIARAQPQPQALLPGPRAWARPATRCRVERDGAAQDPAPLKQQFEDGLDGAIAVGLQTLAAAWERLPGLAQPALDATLGLLVGRAAATWGWRLGPGGIEGAALMRLVALLELDALQADLRLAGELSVAGTRCRVTLQAQGREALRTEVRHETPEPSLVERLLPVATARWRLPFTVAVEPIATESAALLQLSAPPTGALVGEAGLRPNTHGGSGWEWFCGLRVEPVDVPLALADPLLGVAQFTQPLLPALTLVDWSLG